MQLRNVFALENNHKNRDKHIFCKASVCSDFLKMALGFRRRSKGNVVEVAALSGPHWLCQQQTVAGLHRAGRWGTKSQ